MPGNCACRLWFTLLSLCFQQLILVALLLLTHPPTPQIPVALASGGNVSVLSIAATYEAYAALVRVDWSPGTYLDATSSEPRILACPLGFASPGAPTAIGLS